MSGFTVSPAYGRDYASGKAAIADLVAGKDFQIHSPTHEAGRYIGAGELHAGDVILIRYKRMTRTVQYVWGTPVRGQG